VNSIIQRAVDPDLGRREALIVKIPAAARKSGQAAEHSVE